MDGAGAVGRKGRELNIELADLPGRGPRTRPVSGVAATTLRALDHRDAIRTEDPLIRLGGLTLEFVAKVVPAPMALFLIADERQSCSLAEMRVDPILASDPARLQGECAAAVAETVPALGLPQQFRHHLLLDRDGLDLMGGFSESSFAANFMPQWGLKSILVLMMRQRNPGPTCLVVLLRTLDEGGFKDREKGFLRQMAPLLSQSWRCATVPGGPGPQVPHRATGDHARKLDTLTRREMEIARLAADGAANEEIAASLGITTGTVKCHIRSVYAKLGVHSRVRLSLLLAGA